jgi:iron complex transport system substrate-binding protein
VRVNQTLEARAVRGETLARTHLVLRNPEDSVKRTLSIAALAALALVGCSSDDTSSTSTEAPATVAETSPAATDAPSEAPQAIVSLSPTATEMLFAIGAGDQVIAVDDMSNYPAEALDKPHDLSGFEPNVEAIAALEPDLVLMQDDTVKDQLEALGIAVWVGPAASSFDDVYSQITELGDATGHADEAATVVADMKTRIEDDIAAVTASDLSVYHELDPTLYSVTSNTFIGKVYEMFGLANIADGVEEGNDYPQLNAEYVVQANPSLIVLADSKCCGESADTVAARPGWDVIDAVKNGRVVVIDDDIASRWGPRLVDYIDAVASVLMKMTEG